MAFVRLVEMDQERIVRSSHPTQLVCKFLSGERDGKKLVQLNSYGSGGRENPDKLSQTLQFDEVSAGQLYMLLAQEFGFGDN
jgi:hypothetical protein